MLSASAGQNVNENVSKVVELSKIQLSEKKLQNDQVDEDCSICFEALNNHGFCQKLLCGHTFHKACLQKWFKSECSEKQGRQCPICRHQCAKIR